LILVLTPNTTNLNSPISTPFNKHFKREKKNSKIVERQREWDNAIEKETREFFTQKTPKRFHTQYKLSNIEVWSSEAI